MCHKKKNIRANMDKILISCLKVVKFTNSLDQKN